MNKNRCPSNEVIQELVEAIRGNNFLRIDQKKVQKHIRRCVLCAAKFDSIHAAIVSAEDEMDELVLLFFDC